MRMDLEIIWITRLLSSRCLSRVFLSHCYLSALIILTTRFRIVYRLKHRLE